ncbi:hypothetical protein G5B40_19835 [Pikeienuella piscinae]|uniref:Uncharacterized protein n=1 Tax=Pikeienuella piscinae TaxID=2748098 RepID=A0A7M3T666_9RHOB|nr:hypothetical protein [Pikeienuella piscinae]QIE57497.1 hypothetical protein G5B40_19835 [Pikeienuella piscinae]
MNRLFLSAAAGLVLGVAGCTGDVQETSPTAATTPAGPSPLAGIASGDYKSDQVDGCAYLTVSGEEPVLFNWNPKCDGSPDFTSRPPKLRVEGDKIFVGRRDTSNYSNIRPSGDGFMATQEFRGRTLDVQFSPD